MVCAGCVEVESRQPWLALSIVAFVLELFCVAAYYVFKDAGILGTGLIWDAAFKAILNSMAKGWRSRLRVLVFLGLIFGIAGDYLLVFSSDILFFYLGMAAFLIGHIFYIVGFWIPPGPDDDKLPWQLWGLLGVSLACVPAFGGLIYLMAIYSPDKYVTLVAVIVYGITEILLLWRASGRFLYKSDFMTEHLTFQIVTFVGSFLFVFSDAILAYNAFYYEAAFGQPLLLRSVWVLGCYWSGQTLIMFGIFLKPVFETDDEELGDMPEEAAKVIRHVNTIKRKESRSRNVMPTFPSKTDVGSNELGKTSASPAADRRATAVKDKKETNSKEESKENSSKEEESGGGDDNASLKKDETSSPSSSSSKRNEREQSKYTPVIATYTNSLEDPESKIAERDQPEEENGEEEEREDNGETNHGFGGKASDDEKGKYEDSDSVKQNDTDKKESPAKSKEKGVSSNSSSSSSQHTEPQPKVEKPKKKHSSKRSRKGKKGNKSDKDNDSTRHHEKHHSTIDNILSGTPLLTVRNEDHKDDSQHNPSPPKQALTAPVAVIPRGTNVGNVDSTKLESEDSSSFEGALGSLEEAINSLTPQWRTDPLQKTNPTPGNSND